MKNTIAMQPVTSSQIQEIGYDPLAKKLAVRFASKSGPGSLYHYDNVEQAVFDEFRGAESIGRFFGERIKPNAKRYPFAKINEDPEAEEGAP